jgi:proteasome lid subunit RPN8/RPN11
MRNSAACGKAGDDRPRRHGIVATAVQEYDGYVIMLIIPKPVIDDISSHSQETYPEECCGILVGNDARDGRIITESHRAENVSRERRQERYIIDEHKLLEVMKATRSLPVDVIGFYHSHPDYPSRPSGYDIETAAWPGYSYLIVSLDGGGVVSFQSWIMPEEGGEFTEEPISVSETGTQ